MDYILRATAGNSSVRAFAAITTETVQKAFEIHKTSPVMTAALGRSLTGAAIMGSMLKSETDLLTITVRGDGPGQGLVVTSDCKARVKGYVFNPNVDIPLKPNKKLDVQGALGEGSLTVVKDLGLKEPYVGQIPLVSGEIAEDLTYYFAKSEQIPSAVALGVLIDKDCSVKQAGGFVIQMMPDADEEIADKIDNKLTELKPVTKMLDEGMSAEDILEEILGEFGVEVLDRIEVSYFCSCSRERVEKALLAVGKKELAKIIEEDKKANLHCHFCNKDYEFSEEELIKLLQRSFYTRER